NHILRRRHVHDETGENARNFNGLHWMADSRVLRLYAVPLRQAVEPGQAVSGLLDLEVEPGAEIAALPAMVFAEILQTGQVALQNLDHELRLNASFLLGQ